MLSKRKIYSKFLEWKNETKGQKALLKYIRDCFDKGVPLERSIHEKAMLIFKQYLLVGGMPMSDEVYKQILTGELGLNEGMIYENVIAQMLVANGHRLFFYTHYNGGKKRNDIETDFIIYNNSNACIPLYCLKPPEYLHWFL